MVFKETEFEGLYIIEPKVFSDNRGFFLESYSKELFEKNGISIEFVQDNHSRSVNKGVVRGLHFQKPPKAQTKLVRTIQGAIYDVVLDIRRGSLTYGKWAGFELSAENFKMLYVPAGFAHGFCTLVDNTEVQYKVDNLYSPANDAGLRWNDPDLNIKWPVSEATLSAKDNQLPFFEELNTPF